MARTLKSQLEKGVSTSTWMRRRVPGDSLSFQHFPSHVAHHNCTNVHAIARSPRGDGSEAVVLVTPVSTACISTGSKCEMQTIEGAATALSVGLGMFEYMTTVQWLAKDFVWLVPDSSCGVVESVSAWMEEYQGMRHDSSAPFARAGTIQQVGSF